MKTKSYHPGEAVKIPRQICENFRKWAELFEHAEWGIVVCSADGTIRELMNPAFARMHGYTVEELTGRPIAGVFAPGEREKLSDYTRIIHEMGHITYESMHLRKDGSVFPVLMDATAIRDDAGRVLYRAVHVRDINNHKRMVAELEKYGRQFEDLIEAPETELQKTNTHMRDATIRKRQEEAIYRSQIFLQSTLDSLASNVAILDESGEIIFVNTGWRRFAEANHLDLSRHGLGINYLKVCEFATGEDAPLAQEALDGLKALLACRTDLFTLDYPCHSPAEKRWFNMRATRFMDGESPRVVVTHLDITKSKLAQQTLQDKTAELGDINTTLRVLLRKREEDREKLKKQLLANIKELVEPYLEKLKKSRLSIRQKSYLDIVDRNLKEVAMPFADKLSSMRYKLTHMELQVANLVMQGKTSKEISELLNLSWQTINTHRKNIRKKIGIRNKTSNLRVYLLSNHNG